MESLALVQNRRYAAGKSIDTDVSILKTKRQRLEDLMQTPKNSRRATPPHQRSAVAQAVHRSVVPAETPMPQTPNPPVTPITEPLPIQSVRGRIAEYVENGALSADVIEILYNDSVFIPAEGYLFDYKKCWPESRAELCKYVKHVAAFHNVFGGYIFFGVHEVEAETIFKPCAVDEPVIDIKQFKDILREYLNLPIEVDIRTHAIKNETGEQRFVTLMHIPRRAVGHEPNAARKDLNNDKGKPVIKFGEIYIRDGDNSIPAQTQQHWKTVYGHRKNPYLVDTEDSGINILENNLPDRSLIYGQFVGRTGELERLWEWFSDDFSRVRVLAGEGGHGKTSIAYEFASDFCRAVPAGFDRVIWLTAKKQQFRAFSNSYEELGIEVFGTPAELMRQLGSAMKPSDVNELISCQDDMLPRLVKRMSTDIAALVVIDDLDSLDLDEQKRCIEICQQFSTTKSRFLFTTRKNVTASSASSIEVKGFEPKEFKEFVDMWTSRLGLNLIKNTDATSLLAATGGSPLFTESVLRLIKQGVSFNEAVKLWKDKLGIEVRNAALQREVKQLGMEARKVLVTVAAIGSCSFSEIKALTGFTEQTIIDASNELQSLFLLSTPPIAKERRFAVSSTTRLLVKSMGQELVPSYEIFVREILDKKYQASGEGRRTSLKVVASAIDQAMAQIADARPGDALKTVDEVNNQLGGKNPDLLSVKARALAMIDNQSSAAIRKAFETAYDAGQRKEVFFDHWYRAEMKAQHWDGAIQAIDYALRGNEIENPGFWIIKRLTARFEAAVSHRTADPEHAVNQVKAAVVDFRLIARSFGIGTSVENLKIRKTKEQFADLHWDIPRKSNDFAQWLEAAERQLEFIGLGDWRLETYIRAAVALVGLRSAGAPKGITQTKLREILQIFDAAPHYLKSIRQFREAHAELRGISAT